MANLGPIQLPPEDAASDLFTTTRPVLAPAGRDLGRPADGRDDRDDALLLVTSNDRDELFAVDARSGALAWTLDGLGAEVFTTPRTSPDGAVAYFGKGRAVHAVDLADGSRPWGAVGRATPAGPTARGMDADLSVSSTGEVLYYNSAGAVVSALRVAEVVLTASPAVAPSGAPSAVESAEPSASLVPSLPPSLRPSRSASPSADPDNSAPSVLPTTSARPSSPPSAFLSGSPSSAASNLPSSLGGNGASSLSTPTASPLAQLARPTTSPLAAGSTANVPTANPISSSAFPPNANPPSASAERTPDETNDDVIWGLSMPAVIGIATGAGVLLILLLGSLVWFIRKRRNSEDDGVDTDWQQSSSASESNRSFQYSGNNGPEPGFQQSSNNGSEPGGLQW